MSDHPQRKRIISGLAKGFDYLESRLMGTCDATYSCEHMYEVAKLAQVLDPQYAATALDPE